MGNHYGIAIFSAQYLPHTGGVENYTYHLACEFARMGHRVAVIALNNCDVAAEEGDPAGFRVLRLPCHNTAKSRYPIARKNAEYRRLLSQLDAEPLDFAIVNARFYPHSVLGVRYARSRGITPVAVEHGSAHLTMGGGAADAVVAQVEHALTRRVLKSEPRFYAVSKMASAWLGHFGITSSGELSNAIDAAAFRASASSRDFRRETGIEQDALMAAFVGRLVPEKGVVELAQAAKQVGSERVQVLIAGEGPLRAQIEETGAQNVHLLGKTSSADTAALLSQADVFCLPTRSEGFSTSLLEASACGTPAVITDVGGARELIPSSEFGTIIADRKAETVAAALDALAADRALLARQGSNVKKRVEENFSWQATAKAALRACELANSR